MNYIFTNFGFTGAVMFKVVVLSFFGIVVLIHHNNKKEK